MRHITWCRHAAPGVTCSAFNSLIANNPATYSAYTEPPTNFDVRTNKDKKTCFTRVQVYFLNTSLCIGAAPRSVLWSIHWGLRDKKHARHHNLKLFSSLISSFAERRLDEVWICATSRFGLTEWVSPSKIVFVVEDLKSAFDSLM